MRNNRWLWASTVCGLWGASVVAFAHGPEDWAKADANGDGAVSQAEFEAAALDHWNKADANHDGKVTTDEMKAMFAAKHDEDAHAAEAFAKMDSNGDGKIERSEVAKMPDPMFKKLDTDKDGAISPAEFDKHPDAHAKGLAKHEHDFKQLPGDGNNDGAVTKDEAQAEAQKMFKKLDTNGDGKLSKEELMAMHKMAGGPGGPGGAGGGKMPGMPHGKPAP